MKGKNAHGCPQKVDQKSRSTLGSFLLHPCSIKVMAPLPNAGPRRQQQHSSNSSSSRLLQYQSNDQFMEILLLDAAAGRRADDDDGSSDSDSVSGSAAARLVETPAMHAASESSRDLSVSQDAMDVSSPFYFFVNDFCDILRRRILEPFRQLPWM